MGQDKAGGAKREVFDREFTVDAWDEDYYHPIARAYYDRAVPDMLRAMGAQRGDRVLDAGCGPGVHAIRAARYGCEVTAGDLSPTMLRHAKARAEHAGVAEHIRFTELDLTAPQLAEQFPFVFSWGVVIHIPDTAAALDGLAGLVAPGGRLALQVLSSRALDFKAECAARFLLRKPLGRAARSALGVGNWYEFGGEDLWVLRFDPEGLQDAMQARGFRLVSTRGAEFSEFQNRTGGRLRAALLRLNSAAYALRLPAGLFATRTFIFEK